jgi:hypothetical protein
MTRILAHPFTWLVLTVATIVTSLALYVVGPRRLDWLPAGFERPVLALEVAKQPQDFTRITQQSALDPAGKSATPLYIRATWVDFSFIAAYGALWLCLTLCLGDGSHGRPLRLIGAFFVVVAVVADCVEDAGMLQGLGSPAPPPVALISSSAFVKWGALGVVFLILLWCFWPQRRVRDGWQLWEMVNGLAYGYAGILCLLGVFYSAPLLERTVAPLSIALLIQIPAFWHRYRERVTSDQPFRYTSTVSERGDITLN